MRRMFGFMIGIVVGALIGAAVALLLAPETGDKFRNEIRARGEILINDVRHAANGAPHRADRATGIHARSAG